MHSLPNAIDDGPAAWPVVVRFVICLFRGHRWDVAPGFRRGNQIECVRCGLRADPVSGLGR